MKKDKLKILFIATILIILTTQCKIQKLTLRKENKNFQTAKIIYNKYFKTNKNAFLFSIGTVGPKYIWTIHADSIELTFINTNGHKTISVFKTINNWTLNNNLEYKEPDCLLELDGDVQMFKITKQNGSIIDKSLAYQTDCLEKSNDELFKAIFNDMKTMKIRE